MSKNQEEKKKRYVLPLIFGAILGVGGVAGGLVLAFQSNPVSPKPTDLVTLKFNGNGGTIDGGKDTVQVRKTDLFGDVIKPSVTSPGYTFNGWYAEAACTNPISTTAPISNVPSTIYAGWVAETNIKVTFKPGKTGATIKGPAEVAVTQSGTTFSEINKPIAVLADTSKIFDHWSKSEDVDDPIGKEEVIPNIGITLYPVFVDAPTSYVLVRFNAGDGQIAGTTEFNVPVGTPFGTVSKPIATQKGKDFSHWSLTDHGETPVDDNYSVENSVTFYAVYKDVEIEEKFSFQDAQTNKTYWLTNPSDTTGPLVFHDLDGNEHNIERSKFNETLKIGNKVKSIPINFLYECYAFNNGQEEGIGDIPLVIPSSVESIGDSFLHLCIAFNQPVNMSACSRLTSIGSSFMQFCTTFNSEIVWPETLTDELTIGAFFLQSCLAFNQEMILPNNITTIPGSFMGSCEAFNNGDTLYDGTVVKPFVIPSSVTKIESYFLSSCFAGVIGGKAVGFNQPIAIPASVTSIAEDFLYGDGAFNSSVTFATTGCQITKIEDAFLSGCTRFNKSFVIPSTVTTIGDFFMYDCIYFNQALDIPANVTSLGNSFMSGCQSFNQNITLRSQLTHIGTYFMYACHSMVNTITVSCNPSTVFAGTDLNTLSSGSPTSPCVINGIKINGTYKNALATLFSNRIPGTDTNEPPYRNLIVVS